MSLLVRLSEDLFIEIFAWCKLKDLISMDNAFCVHRDRKYILGLFKCPHFIMKSINCDDDNLKWVSIRDVKMKQLVNLHGCMFANNVLEPMLNTSAVVRLHQCGDDGVDIYEDEWINLINSCPNLNDIYIQDAWWLDDKTILKIDSQILSQLTSLSMVICHICEMTDQTIDCISNTCIDLRIFEVYCSRKCGLSVTEDSQIRMLQKHKNMTSIRFDFDPAQSFTHCLFDYIANHCTGLTKISISHCPEEFTLYRIGNMLKSCTNLTNVTFQPGNDYWDNSFVYELKNKERTLKIHDTNESYKSEDLHEFFSTVGDFDKLEFYRVTHLNDQIMTLIANNNSRLSSMRLLTCGSNISLKSLEKILSECKELSHFYISSANHISGDDFVSLFTNTTNYVQDLLMCDHIELNSDHVIAILKSCVRGENLNGFVRTRLRSINCSRCKKVDFKAVENFLQLHRDRIQCTLNQESY